MLTKKQQIKNIIAELESEIHEIIVGECPDHLAALQSEREIRQALERVRRLKECEEMTYEKTAEEPPRI